MRLAILLVTIVIVFPTIIYGEMYKWVDEKGTIHFADDLSNIPERYRPDAEIRKGPKESSVPDNRGRPAPLLTSPTPMVPESRGYDVSLLRRGELWLAEVLLNGRVKRNLIVDTGASFTLISRQAATDLGLTVDENTPFIRAASVSDVILLPLVTLDSIRVGNAEVENVEAVIYTMPYSSEGLLGNSFLNKFRVGIDSVNGKMTLHSMKGVPSPDRPGGYTRDYWIGQFRFYHRNLADLKMVKMRYENQGNPSELKRINNAIRYFEHQLNELERRASFAGVPRNWRE